METSEFKSINDVADIFSGIKIKKMKEFEYKKSDVGLYAKELKENGYILLRWDDYFNSDEFYPAGMYWAKVRCKQQPVWSMII